MFERLKKLTTLARVAAILDRNLGFTHGEADQICLMFADHIMDCKRSGSTPSEIAAVIALAVRTNELLSNGAAAHA